MNQLQFVFGTIPMVVGAIVVMELFFFFQVKQIVYAVKSTALKAAAVISASKISDHWKEKILPSYAAKIMASTFRISYVLGFLVVSFGIVYGCLGMFVFESLPEGFEQLLRLDMQCIVLSVSMIYGVLRNRLGDE